MADLILAQLSVKEPPKQQQPINIKVKKATGQQPVTITTKITDKRPEVDINRQELLAKIGQVKKKIPLSKIQQEEKDYEELQEIEKGIDEDEGEGQGEGSSSASISKPSGVVALGDISAPISSTVDKPKKKLVLRPASGAEVPKIKPTYTITGPISLPDDFSKRLPQKEPPIFLRAPAYYMNNREIFINFITSFFQPYKKEIEESRETQSCESKGSSEFSALTHQKIVRDYINLYTPYRGLILYHGLGSGKTCSSIGIAEGIKTDKQIIIMLPASLRVNYREELKKCGDKLYKKNQYWEFIDIKTNPTLLEPLAYALSISIEFIKKHGGAWFVNVNKPSNYDKLSSMQQISLDNQLTEMIKHKYTLIGYNGLTKKLFNILTQQETINPFDNKVVIIDEAHNFVSRIVNKLKKSDTMAMKLYHYLMSAENAKIILLTGTPIINYPNEIAITMNILRGYIKSWSFKLSINTQRKITQEVLLKLFKAETKSNNILDYLHYKPTSNTLIITRNPYGYYTYDNKKEYKGVAVGEDGNIDDDTFIKIITQILLKNEITIVPDSVEVNTYKCLPDSLDDFSAYFIEKGIVKNMNLFKKRILGLVSYFPDIDALLPRYDKTTNLYIVNIPMSDYQFGVYEQARLEERKIEKRQAQQRAKAGDLYEDGASTYRIFSRAFCNFVFPRKIPRPLPREATEVSAAIIETANEDLLDAISVESDIKAAQEKYDEDELQELLASSPPAEININYEKRIQQALELLEKNKEEYLTPKALETYSPKFLNILSNLLEEQYRGLHLIYSQFKTLEGIGILSLILKTNGFTEFKIKKDGGVWKFDIPIEERGKPAFVLYTGSESPEEKEIIRNIFNSNWDVIPINLREELVKISENNYLGEIIKVIMITASGAEGISLSNVRYVHITEPYWHPVRIEQVIGRARRICSHKNLPKELQTVEVFIYLMMFTDKQLETASIDLKINDTSKLNYVKLESGQLIPCDESNKADFIKQGKVCIPIVFTSDQALYEIATIKENINKEILHNIKEAAIDCNIHLKPGNKEKLQCFGFGSVNANKFAYTPNYSDDERDNISSGNKIAVKLKLKKVDIKDVGQMAVNIASVGKGIVNAEVFTLDSVKNKSPVQVGYLIMDGWTTLEYVAI
jgi:hypothetical protein